MHVVTSAYAGMITKPVAYADGTNTRCTLVLITSVHAVPYLVHVVHVDIKIPF